MLRKFSFIVYLLLIVLFSSCSNFYKNDTSLVIALPYAESKNTNARETIGSANYYFEITCKKINGNYSKTEYGYSGDTIEFKSIEVGDYVLTGVGYSDNEKKNIVYCGKTEATVVENEVTSVDLDLYNVNTSDNFVVSVELKEALDVSYSYNFDYSTEIVFNYQIKNTDNEVLVTTEKTLADFIADDNFKVYIADNEIQTNGYQGSNYFYKTWLGQLPFTVKKDDTQLCDFVVPVDFQSLVLYYSSGSESGQLSMNQSLNWSEFSNFKITPYCSTYDVVNNRYIDENFILNDPYSVDISKYYNNDNIQNVSVNTFNADSNWTWSITVDGDVAVENENTYVLTIDDYYPSLGEKFYPGEHTVLFNLEFNYPGCERPMIYQITLNVSSS